MPRDRSSRFGAPLRWTVRVVALVLVIWIIASVVVLLRVRSSADAALDRLDTARENLSATALLRGAGRDALGAATSDFRTAHDRAGSPILAPWKVIPLASQNVKSAEALTAAAAKVTAITERAASKTSQLLKVSPTTGAERLALLQQLEHVSGRAADRLRDVDLGPDFFLVGPLGDARDRFIERLDQLRQALRGARSLASGFEQLLRGPRRYLVLAANNGEMRAGSGMLLSAGVVTFQDGTFSVGSFEPSADFNLPAGAVPVPPELDHLWGFLHPTQEWRNLASTPRFDVTAPLAADMWRAATGQTVDGVLAVDPATLRALVAAQGPINVAGRDLTSDNVLGFLLRDQYAGVSIGDPQAARRDVLGTVATAALDTLQSRAWRSTDLVAQLGSAGTGRHILAWARDPKEEKAWAAGGIDGALHADSLAVSLLNVGGNKLDQFVHVDAHLAVDENDSGGHDVTVRVKISNEAPTGLPSYIAGPHPATDLEEGEYRAILSVNSPGAGSLPRISGLPRLLVAGIDGPTKTAAAADVQLARGATLTVTIRFQLPDGLDAMTVEPSARIPPVTWTFGDRRFTDTHPERLEW